MIDDEGEYMEGDTATAAHDDDEDDGDDDDGLRVLKDLIFVDASLIVT